MPVSNPTMLVAYRDIPGFIGYRIGDDGSVWSQRRIRWGWKPTNPWRRLSPGLVEGYPRVDLYSGSGKASRHFVHRLVLEAFVGPYTEGMVCRHLDGSRTNNRLENLAWGTYRENEQDKVRHGRSQRGERNCNAKLTEADVLEMLELRKSGQTLEAIAARYDVAVAVVSKILLGKSWQHVARDACKPHVHHGTVRRGDAHNMCKLTAECVIEIRRLRGSGLTLKAIGTIYSVTESTVSSIALGKTWRHLLADGA